MKRQRTLNIYALPDSDDEVRMKPVELKMSYEEKQTVASRKASFFVTANVYRLIKGPMRTVTHLVKME